MSLPADYNALPAANTQSGRLAFVLAAVGIPGVLGYKPSGLYYSNGISWSYLGTPYNTGGGGGGGGPTETVKSTYTAGVIINGGKAVMLDTDGKVYPFDITNSAHYNRYIGVAETAAAANDPCVIVLQGKSELIGSGWTAGTPYYIAASSLLTSVRPATGLIKQVGVGVTTDVILIQSGLHFVKT